MKVFHTDSDFPTSETEKLWVYNGLDCCITNEVLDALLPQLGNETAGTYAFSRDLQGPILQMNVTGVRIDQRRRGEVLHEFEQTVARIGGDLHYLLKEGIGVDINWRSPAQLKTLFYGVMGFAPIKKKGVPTVDRDALEKLAAHFYAEPIINHLLVLRDLQKKIGFLRTAVDPDGRMRTSFNIAGTTTGRLSSALSDFGTGTNLQNIEDSLRSIFIADPGMKFANIDLEQGDSRNVGAIIWNLFGDSTYLDACESGDLHTGVAKLVWPTLAWTGDGDRDKHLAETPYYRHYSYRYMCKKLGHGSNYLGTPPTLAKQAKVHISLVKEFQPRYFHAFPGIPRWQQWVRDEIARRGVITTLLGRRRYFFGRRNDDSTIREAVAFEPQSLTADEVNLALLAIWRAEAAQPLLQVHDSLLLQFPEDREEEVIPRLMKLMEVPIDIRGRRFVVPSEAKTGWNWGSWSESNPDGLTKFKGSDSRRRTQRAKTSRLDFLLR